MTTEQTERPLSDRIAWYVRFHGGATIGVSTADIFYEFPNEQKSSVLSTMKRLALSGVLGHTPNGRIIYTLKEEERAD